MNNNLDTSYFDLWGNICELTKDELLYFEETVAFVKKALSVDIDISPCNHEKVHKGKGKEALGVFYTSDLEELSKDCYITIDNYFIHECYREKFHGDINLNFKSLEEVICHEIAHSKQFRHCKKHSRIATELLDRVETSRAGSSKGRLDEMIANAEVERDMAVREKGCALAATAHEVCL